MQANRVFVGVDVAKSTLSSCVHGSSAAQNLRNTESAIKHWLQALPAQAVIAMESTGAYHQLLAQLAHQSGRTVYVLNARDVYFYAKALGARSKTDRVDAQVIARYLAEHHAALHPWHPGSAALTTAQQLLQRRAGVVTHRLAVRTTLDGLEGLQETREALEAQFDRLLRQIDRQVQSLVCGEPLLRQGYERLCTITGIGAQGAALLVCLFSRLHFANADALVAYCGLDLRANDSGAKSGRRRLSKRGNAAFRRQLYLAAFAASHSNALGPLYRSIKAKGFKPTQALIILARKLLRIAWAVWNSGQPFDPTRFVIPQACAKT